MLFRSQPLPREQEQSNQLPLKPLPPLTPTPLCRAQQRSEQPSSEPSAPLCQLQRQQRPLTHSGNVYGEERHPTDIQRDVEQEG